MKTCKSGKHLYSPISGSKQGCPFCKKEADKKYSSLNQDKIKLNRRNYYINNKEKVLDNNKKWKLNNYEKYKEISKKYWETIKDSKNEKRKVKDKNIYKLKQKEKKEANKEKQRLKRNEYSRKHYHLNKEENNIRAKIYRSNNKDKIKQIKYKCDKEYYLKNSEKIKSRAKNHRLQNIDHYKENKKRYKKENAGKVNALGAKRHAAKLKATPSWLSKEQLKEIEQYYIEAKELQWLSDPTDPLCVDHIEPLQGKDRCGLHVPWNLQILPRSLNSKKGNKTN